MCNTIVCCHVTRSAAAKTKCLSPETCKNFSLLKHQNYHKLAGKSKSNAFECTHVHMEFQWHISICLSLYISSTYRAKHQNERIRQFSNDMPEWMTENEEINATEKAKSINNILGLKQRGAKYLFNFNKIIQYFIKFHTSTQ